MKGVYKTFVYEKEERLASPQQGSRVRRKKKILPAAHAISNPRTDGRNISVTRPTLPVSHGENLTREKTLIGKAYKEEATVRGRTAIFV